MYEPYEFSELVKDTKDLQQSTILDSDKDIITCKGTFLPPCSTIWIYWIIGQKTGSVTI
jgi:hypothetical protein